MFEKLHRATAKLIYLERALWLAGALLLGWTARTWVDAAQFQERGRELIASQPVAPDAPADAPVVVRPADGEAFAALTIPRLGVDVVVAEGTSPETLNRAAGRIAASSFPGDGGNVAIAAHRDSFFRPLQSIEAGDLAVLRGAFGERRYRVEWTRIVDPHEVEVVAPTPYPALTLVTCYPFGYVGSAPRRFIVRARIVDEAGMFAPETASMETAFGPAV